MARILTTAISGSQCIGDSLIVINNNYEALDTVVYALSTNTISPSSTATVTPTLLDSTTSYPWQKTLAIDVNNSSITPVKLSTGAPTWNTSGNVGIGTSSPNSKLTVVGVISATGSVVANNNVTTTTVSSVSGYFTNLSVSLSSNAAIGTYIGKFPIFTASGALLGHVPIYNP
jgi:hypothetical protein